MKISSVMIGLLLAATLAFGDSRPPLLIAYFVPSDREAIPGYPRRLDAVMTEVQRFYREGMQVAGYGPATFRLERDAGGALAVHVVRGKQPMRSYGRNDSDKVRAEVDAALRAQGIRSAGRTMVIFQVLLAWDRGVAVEVGPYVGGGNHLEGTAWVYDDALLNPKKLGSREPGGYYMQACSVGEFNSHYVGGVAHELGHALGLPHVAGAGAAGQHSLMGDGNHTYGQELRGEGRGTYLHPASAMLLAKCRAFAGPLDTGPLPECNFTALQARFEGGQLLLAGTLPAPTSAFGVIAYNDRLAIPADYDATGWTSEVDPAGRFDLAMGDLHPGAYELRLQVCHTNGATTTSAFRYEVNAQGVPNLAAFAPSWLLFKKAARAFAQGNREQVLALVGQIEKEDGPPDLLRQARHLRALLQPRTLKSPAAVDAGQSTVPVSDLEFVSASVGWASPLRDQVLAEGDLQCFLQVDGKYYERGLFAHAPSSYVLDLGGGWRHFTTRYGLQDGHGGSVVFVIRGDGRELFRSDRIDRPMMRRAELPIEGLRRLELLVEDAGDGPGSDWGVWLEPILTR